MTRLGWRDHAVGLLLAVTYVALLVATASELGMSRDEGFYVDASTQYARWLELLWDDPDAALERTAIDRAWTANHEHPSLSKVLFGLGWLAQDAWDLFGEDSLSFRFWGMASAGLLLWLLYIFGARAYGRQVAVFAVLAYALLPRVFYNAHLDCFDVPIVLMLTLVTYCYWRSLSSPLWAIWTGLAYGLALETKHNAWILPGILLIHWLWVVVQEVRARRAGRGKVVSIFPWWLVSMGIMGPPIFVGLWPWLWHDTAARFEEYAAFHLDHVHYNMAYFGQNYFAPPMPISFPWVMTAFTVPATTLLLAIAGLVLRARAVFPAVTRRLFPGSTAEPDRRHTDVLFIGSLFAPLVVISMPWTPIFGGTKHWLTAYPFLCLFAGVAFVRVARALRRSFSGRVPGERHLPRVLAAALLLAPAAVETIHSHPFGLSHYGFFAGGVPGAADYGMNRQFWGFTTGSLVDYFNERMPNGGSVWICDTTWTAWRMLQRDGRLSPEIRASGDLASADFAIVHHEHHFVEVDFQIWQAFGEVAPVHVLTYDGVPIVSVYENPRHRSRSQRPVR